MGLQRDVKGKRYGKLVPIKIVDTYALSGEKIWECLCDCGEIINVRLSSLVSGNTKSCGCHQREVAKITGEKSKKFNTYDLSGEYGVGYTAKGEEFYFDLEDYELIKNYCWYIDYYGYVQTNIKKRHILFHRFIMNPPDNMDIDHKNGNTTDNRKSELRLCTRQQNLFNVGLRKNNKSGTTGVCKNQSNNWYAQICVSGKVIHLGTFSEKNDAIKARKDAEKKYFGNFVRKDDIDR